MPGIEVLGLLLGLLVRQWRHVSEFDDEQGVSSRTFWIDFTFRWAIGLLVAIAIFLNPDVLQELSKTIGLGIEEGSSGFLLALGLGLAIDQFAIKLIEGKALPKETPVSDLPITAAKDKITSKLLISKGNATGPNKDKIDVLIGNVAKLAVDAAEQRKLLKKDEAKAVNDLITGAVAFADTFAAGYDDENDKALTDKLKEILAKLTPKDK